MAIAVTLSTVFNSLEDTKSPAIFGAGSNLLSKIGLNILLIGPLGAAGLAVATSLKYVVSAILLAIVLGWKLQGLAGSVLLKAFAKITVASILAMLPVGLMSAYWPLPALAQIAMGTLVGATTYLLCAALLRIPELFQLYAYLGQLRNGQQIEHRLDE
jgi:putative peptidoglycan lipid II flippase